MKSSDFSSSNTVKLTFVFLSQQLFLIDSGISVYYIKDEL